MRFIMWMDDLVTFPKLRERILRLIDLELVEIIKEAENFIEFEAEKTWIDYLYTV